ncbi:helix-turn-helix domain-containing protein [Aetokthonos hydrillicola Thurmond2011]|jgi:transcriptional regulator with XRE-family HTH domain|uniref:Helix-turn-helix domain-containing protein n=1 Tax=Aetokthonos hydrillicola Thurmond2011 TaxID=2712845 RepID=A0AAP5I9J3_9CYAN|nr:helix-turn-helix transcriptional regulator [Aetokthonos hydrillicola]MBO3464083.1 helix-turn-helix transcriptional regulator [Aetokthonos hydrillicola CCALA 1050]MBW4585449.1 helix-turn-helix domain-containing protein [Aetokthonos hydrillicola CCALA 1050]MDR9896067.1 helix-turn-helix domain-containing protein [Aetokthonos hydrillicola Thurmond2011]
MPLSRSLLVAKQPNIGQLVRALRQEFNLSQEKFAAKLGVTFPTINRWENKNVIPSPLAMQQIDNLLNELGERGDIIRTTFFPEEG